MCVEDLIKIIVPFGLANSKCVLCKPKSLGSKVVGKNAKKHFSKKFKIGI